MESKKATLKDWILLTRPWSITAPLVPFLVALGWALSGNMIEPGGWVRWGLALASAITLVLTCNLFNTWGDEVSGVDRTPGVFLTTPQIQEGKITLRQTFVFGCILFVLAGALGIPTLFYPSVSDGGVTCVCKWLGLSAKWRFNLPLFVMAVVGFLGAVNYSTGIKYKYHGLGVPFVALLQGVLYMFVVMEVVAPEAFTHQFDFTASNEMWAWFPRVLFVGVTLPVAALVGVILHGNDMRDIATDRRAGITTLAGVLKPKGSLVLFVVLHAVPYLVVLAEVGYAVVAASNNWEILLDLWSLALPLLVLPLTVRLVSHAVRDYRANPEAPAWLDLEKGSGGIHFIFGLLYALSFALLSSASA